MIEITDHNEFFNLQQRLDYIPFTQSEAWFNMVMNSGMKIRFFVNAIDNLMISTWGLESKIPLINKVIFRVNGESIKKNAKEKIIKGFYCDLKSYFEAIEIDSNSLYNIDYEIGIRRAGFRRPIGVFSCPLTIVNNLQVGQSRNRRWKRNLESAKASNLVFAEIPSPNENNIKEFVLFFGEMAKTKALTYKLNFNDVNLLLSHKSTRLFKVSTSDDQTLAYRIIQVNKDYAYDVYASNSNKSRDCNGATYYLIERIFDSLRNESVKYFDFGRIPPSDHSTDKIYEFKTGSRGEKVQYNGEWTFYKSKFIELLVFLYKYFKLKKQRY